MQNSYTNKIVLVTGGTSGIGKATALAFAEAGAKVVITGRREKEGANVVAEITKNGRICLLRNSMPRGQNIATPSRRACKPITSRCGVGSSGML